MDQKMRGKIHELAELFSRREEIDNQIEEALNRREGLTLFGIPVVVDEEFPKSEVAKGRLKKKIKSVVETKTNKKWSLKYDCCKNCGTVSVPHMSKGLCRRCYQNHWNKSKNKTVKTKRQGKKGIKNDIDISPKSSAGTYYTCLDCNEKIFSVLDKIDVVCPKCGSTHVY